MEFFSAIILTGAVFAARPIILAMGFGEQLLLIVLALNAAHVNGDKRIEGANDCGVGLLIGSIGAAPATGEFRMTFDSGYLSDGIPVVIVGLGMFALPEIVDLRRNTSISETGTQRGWLQGLKDASATSGSSFAVL